MKNKFYRNIKKNKDIIAILISAVIGLSSIITGFSTIIVMNRQTELLNIDKQPMFRIDTELISNYKSGYYEGRMLNVYNEGYSIRYIHNIDVKTFIKLSAIKNNKVENYILPIIAYYSINLPTSNLKGQLFTAFSTQNNKQYNNLYTECMEHKDYYKMSVIDVLYIKYKDANYKNNEVFFENKVLIDKSQYEEYLKVYKKYQLSELDISKITFNNVMNIIDAENE